jgi:hypothetical protein
MNILFARPEMFTYRQTYLEGDRDRQTDRQTTNTSIVLHI